MKNETKKSSSSMYSFFNKEGQERLADVKDEQSVSIDGSEDVIKTELSYVEIDQVENKEILLELRKFFLSGKVSKKLNTSKGLSSLLKYAQKSNEAGDGSRSFPLWVGWSENDDEIRTETFMTFLAEGLKGVDIPEKIKNKIKREVIQLIDEFILEDTVGSYVLMNDVHKEIIQLPDKLNLTGTDREVVQNALETVLETVPEQGKLVFYTAEIQEVLLKEAVEWHLHVKRKSLLSEAIQLGKSIGEILSADTLDGKSKSANHLKTSMGKAGLFMNLEKMADAIPDVSADAITPKRKKRLELILKSLTNAKSILEKKALIHTEWPVKSDQVNGYHVEEFKDFSLQGLREKYTEWVKPYCELVAAIKIARLEKDDTYDDVNLDPFFSNFSWENLSPEELASAPPFIVRIKASTIYDRGMSEFLSILSQQLPVKFFVQEDRQPSPDNNNTFNLGNISMSFRSVYTSQTTGWQGRSFMKHIHQGICYPGTCVYYILYPEIDQKLDFGWVNELAFLSRTFPHITYGGDFEQEWGMRFDISDNIQKENKWLKAATSVITKDKVSNPFDFEVFPSDFLMETQQDESIFVEIPNDFTSNALKLFSDFMKLSPSERTIYLPYQYAVNNKHEVVRVLPTQWVVDIVLDRMDYWNLLLDRGGVHSYHTDQALESQSKKLNEDFEEKVQTMERDHASEIIRVREEAIASAMENLAAALLDLKVESLDVSNSNSPESQVKEKQEVTSDKGEESKAEESTEEVKEEPQAALSEDPWIDTPLCTSCNECIDLNKSMFKYNADKLAYIADPNAGTFADLVDAAEMCPAGIIHPGTPLNPNEPNLDELVKKAEQYN